MCIRDSLKDWLMVSLARFSRVNSLLVSLFLLPVCAYKLVNDSEKLISNNAAVTLLVLNFMICLSEHLHP